MIYAITDEAGNVKFGVAKNLARRLPGLQTGNSSRLSLLSCMETKDDYRAEANIHAELTKAGAHANGEWFKPCLATTIMAASLVGDIGPEKPPVSLLEQFMLVQRQPIPKPKRKSGIYLNPEARKAYRREWMKAKRASTKLATESQ